MTFLNITNYKILYGERTTAIAKHLEKLLIRKTETEEHINFLKQCKQHNVIPKGFIIKHKTNNYKNEITIYNTMIKLRNNTLQWRYKQLRLNNIEINTEKSILSSYMKDIEPNRNHQLDLQWMNKKEKREREIMQRTHKKKLNNLIEKPQQKQKHSKNNNKNINKNENHETTKESNVVNISNVNLTEQQVEILEKGLKFVPTPNTINPIEYITNTEQALFTTPTLIKKAAISEITTFVRTWKKPKIDNLTKTERKMLNEIKNINNIMVIQADKGGKVVIINKDDYISKIEEKLNDINTYEQVRNPVNEIKKSISKLTDTLFKKDKIKLKNKMELNSIDDLPRIRGQVKIHKMNYSMRLITCSRNTIMAPLSRFIFSLIKELRKTIDNSVNNTSQFVNEISKATITKEEIFASLDIQDMFTNIPVRRAVDPIINRIDQSKSFINSSLTRTDLKKLLLLALNNNYVEFNNKYFKQKHGLPMGNCLSPILADIYLDDYMKKHLNEVNITQKLWRYVDDIIIITKMNKIELNDYVEQLNKIKSKIRFTLEFEENSKINFLDTTLSRNKNDNEINVRWFRKETAANKLLNYNSCHQKSVKKNIVSNMASRIKNTTKNNIEQKEDIERLMQILRRSDYPEKEIQQLIKTTLSTTNSQTSPPERKTEELKYSITLPYTPGMEVLKRKLKKLQIQLYYSYPNKLHSYLNSSTQTKTNSVVYQIKCDCGETYIGETKVGLTKRIKQHEKLIKKDEKQSKSEMVQHIHDKKHQCKFNTSPAIVIDKEVNWRKRRLKEAIHSTVYNSINRHDDIDGMWLPIIHNNSEPIKKKIEYRQQLSKEK
jgi:hypothetical protein